MKVAVHGFFLILFASLQSTWMNAIEIMGVKPNLFLVYSIIISCFSGKKEAATVGFLFGMTLDLIIGQVWGLYALFGMILGFTIAYFFENGGGKRNLIFVFFLVLVCSWLLEFAYYLFSFASVENINLKYAVLNIIIPEGFYNVLMGIIIYLITGKLIKFLYGDKGELIG